MLSSLEKTKVELTLQKQICPENQASHLRPGKVFDSDDNTEPLTGHPYLPGRLAIKAPSSQATEVGHDLHSRGLVTQRSPFPPVLAELNLSF